MNIRDAKKKQQYFITSICAVLALFSCFALPFASVTNQSPPLTLSFTGIEMVGTNWLNLMLASGMLIVAVKCALSSNPFEIERIPLATQEYWTKYGLIVSAMLGLLINVWALFNMKQFFSTYSLVGNHYSVKLMAGGWLLLICMLGVIVSNLLNRVPAPPRQVVLPEAPRPPQQSAAAPRAANSFMPQQRPPSAPMPPQAPPMRAPGRPLPPVPTASPFPAAQQARYQQSFSSSAEPQGAKQPQPQQKPFSLPALPQTPPIQPAMPQKPVSQSINKPPVAPQKGGQSIVQQRPFSLPALPQTPPVQPAMQQKPALPPTTVQPANQVPVQQASNPPANQQRSQQPAAQQKALQPQASAQQKPFSLPGLPPAGQPGDQQKSATSASTGQVVQQKMLSLPGLPQDAKNRATGQKAAEANRASAVAPAGQNPPERAVEPEVASQQNLKDTRSQFMKPPSQAGTT